MQTIEVKVSGIDIEQLPNSSYKGLDKSDLLKLTEDVAKISHKGDNFPGNPKNSSVGMAVTPIT